MLKYQWWLHGSLMCIVSSATHIPCMHQIHNVVDGCRVFDFIFLNFFVIIFAFLTRGKTYVDELWGITDDGLTVTKL